MGIIRLQILKGRVKFEGGGVNSEPMGVIFEVGGAVFYMGYEVIFAECVVADYEVAVVFVFVIFDKVRP